VTFPLAPCTIFLTLAGSQAHGTAGEGSDVDLRGVCVAPLDVRLSLHRSFEQHEGAIPDDLAGLVLPRLRAHPTAGRGLAVKTECVIFDVAKLVGLCVSANPNALEILFSHESDWVLESPSWRPLHAKRHVFLTKKVQQTFLGYAMAQLKKIKSHRAWLLHPPSRKPTREDFGLPATGGTLGHDDRDRIEQAIADKLRGWGIDSMELPRPVRIALQERMEAFWKEVATAGDEDLEDRMRAVATHALQLPPDVAATLQAEKKYRAALRHWEAYEAWKAQRNPARAQLERKHGYDTKHAMHLVRLMRMGLEALRTGDLFVRRPDAQELVAIRNGALSFDELLAEASRLREEMDDAAARSRLPDEVNPDVADQLVFEMITRARA
jgi:predicted nucleotidyltransferase